MQIIPISDIDSDLSFENEDETERCCVCKMFEPKQLKDCVSVIFVMTKDM